MREACPAAAGPETGRMEPAAPRASGLPPASAGMEPFHVSENQ